MSPEATCTTGEATAALGYLTRCFGGFKIPDDEQRAFLRLFVKFPVADVRRAIDESVLKADRRPSPHDLAVKLRPLRPAVSDTRNREPVPDVTPDVVSHHVAEIKRRAGLCRVVPMASRSEARAVAEVAMAAWRRRQAGGEARHG